MCFPVYTGMLSNLCAQAYDTYHMIMHKVGSHKELTWIHSYAHGSTCTYHMSSTAHYPRLESHT